MLIQLAVVAQIIADEAFIKSQKYISGNFVIYVMRRPLRQMPSFSGHPFCGIISLFSVSARFCAPRLSSLAAQPNKQKQMEQKMRKRKKKEQQVSTVKLGPYSASA